MSANSEASDHGRPTFEPLKANQCCSSQSERPCGPNRLPMSDERPPSGCTLPAGTTPAGKSNRLNRIVCHAPSDQSPVSPSKAAGVTVVEPAKSQNLPGPMHPFLFAAEWFWLSTANSLEPICLRKH